MTHSFLSRLFAVCSLASLLALTGCGSGTTYDPLDPTRVIGLGDAYNDAGATPTGRYTVRVASDIAATVVEYVSWAFGKSGTATPVIASTYDGTSPMPPTGVFSYAVGDTRIATGTDSLKDQVDRLIADTPSGLGAKDLLVIAAGTGDIKLAGSTSDAEAAASALAGQVQRLLDHGAKYVLVMLPLNLKYMPFAAGASTYETYTMAFVSQAKKESPEGLYTKPSVSGSPVRVVEMLRDFNLVASGAISAGFSNITSAACTVAPAATDMKGCDSADADTNYGSFLFADNLNLTPAGNRWVGIRLFNATLGGWR